MRIGIDISQTAFGGTGVSNYLSNLVCALLEQDHENEYVLFFSSLRGSINPEFKTRLTKLMSTNKKISIKAIPIPPTILNYVWNKLHILPIETFVGTVDFFLTSDWTEPPARKARKGSILYDLIVYTYPKETASNIIDTQKAKHQWMKQEDSIIFCISESTKKDAEEILKIPSEKLKVLYPGLTL
jgi:hypothetical protein